MSDLKRIALVGLPGSGKSTVGAELAGRLGWNLVDTDAEVVAATGRPIEAIFTEEGEAAFRRSELAVVERLLVNERPAVIAGGGGLMAQPWAGRLLLDNACVVWLDAPDRVLLDRLGGARDRPLLSADPPVRLAELRAARRALYGRAHLRVDASAAAPVVAERLERELASAVRVAVPGHAYHVLVGPAALEGIAAHVPGEASRVAVVADRRVLPLARRALNWLRRAGLASDLISLAGGEAAKTWTGAGRLLERLANLGLGRRDCVVAVGGGTVGDLCGFVAATYLRGVAWINVPTTLLAMVDSAVGGKTGVNLRRGKNLAGAFWQPRSVICDTQILSGLPDRAFRAAFAEIVKYAMIGDMVAPAGLETGIDRLLDRDPAALAAVVHDCCSAKAEVVAADERESDLRAILNYGHTAGHALEAATGYADRLWHGEAVAVGMRVAGRLSVLELGCPREDIEWQDRLLHRCGLGAPPAVAVDEVMARLGADKKAVAGTVRWVLLAGRGQPRTGRPVAEPVVRATLAEVLAG